MKLNDQGRQTKDGNDINEEVAIEQASETLKAAMQINKEWLRVREEAGLKIDPQTAEVEWWYAQTLDPYGVCRKIPAELSQTGREYFTRSPGSDIWVWFGDLPDATRDALWEKHEAKLAFPAGLPVYINGKWYLRKDVNGEELEELIIDYSDELPF